jgi:hypothetical protein
MGRVKTADRKAKPSPHKRKPKAKCGGKTHNYPTFGSAFVGGLIGHLGDMAVTAALFGATNTEKILVAALLPGLLELLRNRKNLTPDDHWVHFQPHCPQICGVPCPPDCRHHGEARFDGCHVCDCLHGGGE